MIIVKDIIKDIVKATSVKLYGSDTGIVFLHGHPTEIVQTLQEYTKAQEKKFPLVALFQDFDESMNPRVGVYNDVTLHMVICDLTKPEYKAPDRYENTFVPTLYPIYEELMRQIKKSRKFMIYDEAPHTKTDRLFWGNKGLNGNTANAFNDCIDAIEVSDLQLSIHKK